MQVNVTFRHLEPSDSLKAFAKEKVEHIKKFLDHASEASIVLSVEKHLHHAEVLVHSGPFFLRGKDKSDDMYASIGTAVDKIERQIKRYKNRLRQHKPAGHHNANAFKVTQQIIEVDEAENTEATTPPPSSRIVSSNDLIAKKMTVDEAVLQLDLMENQFLVFTNAATNQINVIYRRPGEHTYGLIDAKPSA